MSASGDVKPLDPYSLREQFPILTRQVRNQRPLVYLDNAASTQHPTAVIDSIRNVYERDYANVHRGIHTLSERSTDLYEDARETVRAFIRAESAEEIIFTQGTTASINTVARSWGDANLKPNDEILLTIMEHHSNIVPWQQLAERTGAVLKYVPITDDGLLQMEQFSELLGPKTKIVAVTALSNVLGTLNPLEEIIAQAHDAGAVVLVDAAQSTPHLTTDVQTLGADFIAFSGHKMLGPSGIGVLYGRQELLAAMPPFLGGGSMIHQVELDHFTPARLPQKFEAGTPPIVPAIGLATAIDYLSEVGLEAIHQHEMYLTRAAHDLLDGIGGVTILGPSLRDKAGIVSFTVAGQQADDIAQLLDQEGIAVRAGHHCTMPLHQRLGISASLRASFYLYNTLDDVESLGAAIVKAQSILA